MSRKSMVVTAIPNPGREDKPKGKSTPELRAIRGRRGNKRKRANE
ncbi:hypothetical protein ACFFQF_07270 [Haladaptatus pallidirubidus]|nr:hypothetical protein [Haladaptatus pallidirubidus]